MFIRPCVQGQGAVRLVRFQQSVSVSYVLEFGNLYLRFISNGSSIVETAFAITGAAFGSDTTLTVPGNNYNVGDLIFVTGVQGVPQINNRYFLVLSVTASNVVLGNQFTGASINSTTWPAYTGLGTTQRVYTITTPYLASELRQLKFSQKASIMNITHPAHARMTLTLISATNWTLTTPTIGSTAAVPTGVVVTTSSAGSATYGYVVTSIDSNNQESQGSTMGTVSSAVDIRTASGSITVGWTAATGAFAYNIYKVGPLIGAGGVTGSQVGFVGSTTTLAFIDSNIQPDFTQSPPIHTDPFSAGAVHPACSGYFQQRLTLANNGTNALDAFNMSIVGSDNNFDISSPSQADDAISARLVSLEINEIKSMIPMPSGLIMLTTKGAWQVSGGAGGVATQGGPITPQTITATPQSYVGANDVAPILISYDILHIQQKGSIVRDLAYNIYANIYTGNDISILSNHLFFGHQVVEWAYAEEPFKIVWAIREDGLLLSLTILKEQDMYGWARHDTFGFWQSVCTVTEGTTDATYFVVGRPSPFTPGGTVLQVERLADRTFPLGAEDAWCVDAGVKTTQNFPNASLTPSAVSGNVTFTASNPVFDPSQVGSVLRVDGGIFTVTTVISSTVVVGSTIQPITMTIPDGPINIPIQAGVGGWSLDVPKTVFYGLDHLEGQNVSVLADGGVVNNLAVSGGTITLPNPATKVVAGYPFQAQLQTMYLDLGQETNTVQGKRKKIAALTVRVKDSRGIKAGRTFSFLVPIKDLNRQVVMGQPVPLVTSDQRIVMDPLWDVPGQICLQVDDPVPATVLGVVPEIIIGDSPK